MVKIAGNCGRVEMQTAVGGRKEKGLDQGGNWYETRSRADILLMPTCVSWPTH